MWIELISALCLVMVIEGIFPFLNPRRWRSTLATLASMSDRNVRVLGLSSMLLGLVVLMLVR
jgi:uncharacterized protein YjeT (DUF2065 family)